MQKGRIKNWIDERGFGFIQPDDGSEALFFHISVLQAANRRPVVGDVVFFHVVEDDNGRCTADAVSIEGVASVFAGQDISKNQYHHHRPKPRLPQRHVHTPRSKHQPRTSGSNLLSGILLLAVVLIAVASLVKLDKPHFFTGSTSNVDITEMPVATEPALDEPHFFAGSTSNPDITEMPVAAEPVVESQFSCQGKTRCTQMTSCAEATFYLNHCPGSVTDGDGDGRPCEDQWCGH